MPGGEAPPVGNLIRRPDLADTLETLSARGAAGFYTGPRAELLVKGVRDAGGIWSMEDLAAYRIIERQPVRFRYGKVEITTAPPPSAGGVALAQVFNMLGHRNYAQLEDPSRMHICWSRRSGARTGTGPNISAIRTSFRFRSSG